jgi:hypothetical protein
LKNDFWTTDLEDEPCDGCGEKPSKHQGHGRFTCKTCYDAQWCPKCKYQLGEGHVCATPEKAKRDARWHKYFMLDCNRSQKDLIDVACDLEELLEEARDAIAKWYPDGLEIKAGDLLSRIDKAIAPLEDDED